MRSRRSRQVHPAARLLTSEHQDKFNEWVKSMDSRPQPAIAKPWILNNLYKDVPMQVVSSMIHVAMTQKIRWRYEEIGVGSLLFPGFGLPLNCMPDQHFPVLVADSPDGWTAKTLLIREVCMLRLVEELTNKPEWWIKVHDEAITQRWVNEALEVNWAGYVEHADFTVEMAQAVISELKVKADLYEKTGLLPVLDYSAAVLKSDKILTDRLRNELVAVVAQLENVPEDEKDWHPGSNQQVLDLVHPSLWPLVYGRSRIVVEKRINLEESLKMCGTGKVIPVPLPSEREGSGDLQGFESDYHTVELPAHAQHIYLSQHFQWLPCDVTLDVASGKAKIDSYINNLHPVKHAALYPVIEQLIEKSLPAWDIVYRWPNEFETQRLNTGKVGPMCTTPDACRGNPRWHPECRPSNRPLDASEAERNREDQWQGGYEQSARGVRDHDWFQETHKMNLPNADPSCINHIRITPGHVKPSGFFNNASRIQVIVKLASIHLTPENPSYDGGSWHVEGQLNEHICATALYYYDSDNITDSRLDFRTLANREGLSAELHYDQSDYYSIDRTYAIDSTGNTLQDVGSVLTRPGRALFFPNVFMHRVSPFRLDDPTRPGHRKILALFLVDPAIPITSTAHVPPQQKDWWVEETQLSSSSSAAYGSRLPPELRNMVVDSVDFPIDLAEAKDIRAELMAERSGMQGKMRQELNHTEWNFCEH